MNENEMILLTWYKGSEDSPWVVSLEDKNNKRHEVTIGEGGRVAAGPRLSDSLKYMNKNVYRYPMTYDMRQANSKTARLVEVKKLAEEITYIESPTLFTYEVRNNFYQSPFVPHEDDIDLIDDSRYIESAKTENKIISTMSTFSGSTRLNETKDSSILLTEYAENTNIFWLFMEPSSLVTVGSSQIEGYISAYNWPEGYIVPEKIGGQDITDSQRTVTVDLLGLRSFAENGLTGKEKAIAYGLYGDDAGGPYDTKVFDDIDKEAENYLESFINSQNIIAISLQYSKDTNAPVSNNDNILGVAYGTDFTSLVEVENSILNGNFRAININKSLLKERYSKNNEVVKKNPSAKTLPIVEYVNQSEGEGNTGLNPAAWIDEVGITKPPEYSKNPEYEDGYRDSLEEEEQMIEDIVEETVKEDIENNLSRESHYLEGYVNNDIAYVPPKDDRLESGELYGNVYMPNPENTAGAIPYDYTHKVRIGDSMFEVPPLSIRSDKEQANESVPTMRSRNAMQKGIGTTRQVLTLDLYFHDLENINGHKYHAFTRDNGEEVYYYMDGLRSLLAQFMRTPFVPIDNEYINNSLGISNVAMRDIQAQTVEGFPEALSVTLVLEEIDLSSYLMGETTLGSIMNYPLFRWYYQQSLNRTKDSFNKNTYLPEINNLDNTFSFRIADEDYLSNRTKIIREFNQMKKPRDFRRELEKQRVQAINEESNGKKNQTQKEVEDSKSAEMAMSSYKKYQSYYNGLSKEMKNKYGPNNFPVITHSGKEDNLKKGKKTSIPNEEYDIALEAGRSIYGERVNNGNINSIPYNVAQGNLVKAKMALGEKDSMFIAGYQITEHAFWGEIINKHKIPGLLQVKITDKKSRDELWKDLKDVFGRDHKRSPYNEGWVYKSTLLLPAGTVGGVNFISKLEKIAGEHAEEIEEEVDNYTRKYNDLARIVNSSEEDIPMHEITIEDLIPLSLNVGISNNLSLVQTQSAEAPSLQYLGGQQPEIQLTFSTTDNGAKQIDELFRKVGSYAKKYRVGMVTNFMEIENSLVNLFGVKSVLPNVFQINTVDGQPNEKIVTLVLVGFDKTQRRQEAINQFTGGKTTKDMYDLHMSGYDPQVNALYVDEKIKNMELYPDLELPTYKELEKDLKYIDSGVIEIENRRGQVYLDPDFYVSTESTVRKELNELLGDKRTGSVHYSDDIGLNAESNPLDNKGLALSADVTEKINKIDDEELYVDPYLKWQGYEDEESEGEERGQLTERIQQALSGATSPGEKLTVSPDVIDVSKPSSSQMDSWGVEDKNPNTVEVYDYLIKETRRLFGEDEFMSDKDILNTDWWGVYRDKLKETIKKAPGVSSISGTIDMAGDIVGVVGDVYDKTKDKLFGESNNEPDEKKEKLEELEESTPKKYHSQEIRMIKSQPTEYFSDSIVLSGRFNPDVPESERSKALKNGIHKYIEPETSDTIISIGDGEAYEDSDLKISYKENKRHEAHGESYTVNKMPFMRVVMYMKTLIELESGWKQFDEEGSVYINEYDKNENPFKVGIMGAPLTKSSSKSETQRLAWDWKYNITKSLENIKKDYQVSLDNPYYEFHLRRLDWATAAHSGMSMPPIMYTRSGQHDVPYTDAQLPIAPESLFFFSQFGEAYRRATITINDQNAVPMFRSPDGVSKEAMAEEFGISLDEVEELVKEGELTESFNTDQYSLEEKIKHMYVSMQEYNHVGRLVRAFPSFTMMLIDEGKWFQNFRTWDNFYGYNSLNSIDVYKSRKIAADTATISMSNMYGNLTSSETNPGPDLPAFYSVQFWDHYVLGKPTEEQIETRAEIYDQMMLQTGARIHLRMGYGSDATALPVMFNGSITEMTTGEIIEITAQGDAVELQNVISGDPKDDNVGFFNRVQEPRRTIGELMTSKGNWLKDMVNKESRGMFFKDVASGIVHFGSTVDSELGNRAIIPGENKEEFGESLQNVYSQNGMEVMSQWRNSDGSEITKIGMIGKWAKSLITSFGSVFVGASPAFDEANIAVSYYGRTVWDVIQTFSLASQDYVSTVEPFEYRSTLFFGKPHWMMQYRYDSDFIYDSDRKKIDRTITKAHNRTFMQAHVYSSTHNIISNNIMASEDGVYNNVIVTYDGRQAGPIQADSDIRMDKQRTVNVEANLLAPRLIEYYRAEDQALIYGQSALRDFMKDMYKGQYTVIGDPAVNPHDVVYMNDIVSDIHGLHMVKAVHHSMDPEHGYITHIEPDAYVYNFDKELGQLPGGLHSIGKNLNISSAAKAVGKYGGAVVLGSVMNKVMKTISTGYSASILTAAKASISPSLVAGTNTYGIAKTFQVTGGLIVEAGELNALTRAIQAATTTSEVSTATSAATTAMSSKLASAGTSGVLNAGEVGLLRTINKTLALSGTEVGKAGTITKVMDSAKKAGQLAKGIATSKVFIMGVVLVGIEVSTAWIGEWWNRKKQNAEAIKVIPLIHKGHRWTALMNWHKGSVLGDDPSLRDRLMNAEFFDGDAEVNEVFGNSLFKTINFLFNNE